MFSSIASGATRRALVRLEKKEEGNTLSLPVMVPRELSPLLADLAQRPNRVSAANLALVLSHASWRESPKLDEVYRMTSTEFAEMALEGRRTGTKPPLLKTALEVPRAWITGFPSTARFGEGRDLPFDRAAIEVWQLEFDSAQRTVTPRKIVDTRLDPAGEGGSV